MRVVFPVRPEQFAEVFGEGACVSHGRLAAAAKCLFPLGLLIIHEGALLLVEGAEGAGLVLDAGFRQINKRKRSHEL